ncbi:MAG: SRPBCC family protein [Acidimicrobiales bacterium]
MSRGNEATAVIGASPDDVFAIITDISGLPGWNTVITSVVERPDELVPGAEWVVELRAMGQRWRSRSTLVDLDPIGRRFAYRSATDDGNPSWADWTWTVAEDPDGSRVTVALELHPVTFWRRVLLAKVRARQLARTELPRSLAALATAARSATPR